MNAMMTGSDGGYMSIGGTPTATQKAAKKRSPVAYVASVEDASAVNRRETTPVSRNGVTANGA